MLKKISPYWIVVDHLRTLKATNANRVRPLDVIGFYGLPLLLSIPLMLFGYQVGSDLSNALITAFSVFAGLLLNLLLLTFDLIHRPDKVPRVKAQLLRETFANISYCILVSVVVVAILLVMKILCSAIPSVYTSGVVYYLVVNFLLTLMMVLKRVHALLQREMGESGRTPVGLP